MADEAHFQRVVLEGMLRAKVSLDIATADFKAMLVPNPLTRTAESIVQVLRRLARRGVEIRLLHAGVPSSAVALAVAGVAKERLKSPRARLFVALDLPDWVRDGLAEWQRDALVDTNAMRPIGAARSSARRVLAVRRGHQAPARYRHSR